jgi:hypothetical protein
MNNVVKVIVIIIIITIESNDYDLRINRKFMLSNLKTATHYNASPTSTQQNGESHAVFASTKQPSTSRIHISILTLFSYEENDASTLHLGQVTIIECCECCSALVQF